MTLNQPFEITSRLLPGVKIGNDSFISIEFAGETPDGRARYRYYIDTPSFDYSKQDLKSGVGGGSLQSGMESLLSFLGAFAEARAYEDRTGRESENSDLFPDELASWAVEHSDEFSMLQCELSESPDLITD